MDKYPNLTRFYNDYVSSKKYFQHNNIDGNIRITFTSLFNYHTLLDESDKEYIQKNTNRDYSAEIKAQKAKLLSDLRKANPTETSFALDSNSLLGFKIPEFEIFFVAKLYVNSMEIEPEYQTEIHFSKEMKETITMRYKYKDITTDSYITISIYSMQLPKEKQLLGSTTIKLFDDNFNLIQGRHAFKIFPKLKEDYERCPSIEDASVDKEIDSLVFNFYDSQAENKKKQYTIVSKDKSDFSKFTQDNWLNSYIINQDTKRIEIKDDDFINFESRLTYLLTQTVNSYLEIDFPSFGLPVIYEEKTSNYYKKSYKKKIIKENEFNNKVICDPQMHIGKNRKEYLTMDNPITEQYSLLSRISDDVSRDTKPNIYEIENINKLINTPDFIPLNNINETMFWNYRYELLKQDKKYALTKILNVVKWGVEKSETEFIKNILYQWKTVEVCDILYMLSSRFNMNELLSARSEVHKGYKDVRKFAVECLEKVSDEDINFILLQLIQALRYEDPKQPFLKDFLIKKCTQSVELATSFYWFIHVEAGNKTNSKGESGNKKDNPMEEMFSKIETEFTTILSQSANQEIYNNYKSQISLQETLVKISTEMHKVANKTEQKKAKFKALIGKETPTGKGLYEEHFLPLDSKIKINGIVTDKCTVFRSAMFPVKYSFKVTNDTQQYNKKEDPSQFEVMFKFGDDLRQDQLILQIINYMDTLLRKAGQNYEFTTYKVLATSKTDGFVEFVPNSRTIFDIQKSYNTSIKGYIEACANNDPKEIKARTDSFINSCAGYCVVTYLLGIGDRHLENLLVDNKGKLFHIDFGYILGKDPKPSPPLMKLNPEMVDCMGPKGYEEFKNKCINAFWALRENARLIVNMLYLMIDSGIPELNNIEALEKMHDKFLQEQTKQDAANSLINIIEDSTKFYYTMLDVAHAVAAKMK